MATKKFKVVMVPIEAYDKVTIWHKQSKLARGQIVNLAVRCLEKKIECEGGLLLETQKKGVSANA